MSTGSMPEVIAGFHHRPGARFVPGHEPVFGPRSGVDPAVPRRRRCQDRSRSTSAGSTRPAGSVAALGSQPPGADVTVRRHVMDAEPFCRFPAS